MTNREILEAFAAQFSPPLKVVGTRNIDGMPVKDGYFCAAWEDTAKIGVTAFEKPLQHFLKGLREKSLTFGNEHPCHGHP